MPEVVRIVGTNSSLLKTLKEKLGSMIFIVGFEHLRCFPGNLEDHKHTQGSTHV